MTENKKIEYIKASELVEIPCTYCLELEALEEVEDDVDIVILEDQ